MASPSSDLPIGAPAPVQETPRQRKARGERALSIGARLLAGAATFFFLSFFFAYFYLRSVNVDGMWRAAAVMEGHITKAKPNPDQALGVVFVVFLIVSVALAVMAARQEREDSRGWLAPAAGAVVFGLLAVVAQCIEYTQQNFGPTDGAYASVFIAWTGFYLIAVLATMYWLEIQVATEIRARREPVAEPGEGVTVYEHPDRLLPRGTGAAVFFWGYLGALGVLMYVILYLL